jgi:hypothetical protein
VSDAARDHLGAPLATALVAAMVAFAASGVAFVTTARMQRRA